MRNPVQATFFSGTSILTKYFPRAGAALLNFAIQTIVGSRLLSACFRTLNRIKLARVRSFRRILVNPDIHIGDAIMAQAVVTALRDFFPEAEVDFVTNKTVMPLIEGNPDITRLFPIYSGGAFPPDSELDAVGELLKEGKYDLCINSNPFMAGNRIEKKSQPVIDVASHAATFIRNERTTSEVNHFSFQHRRFVYGLLGRTFRPQREKPFSGVAVRLSDAALEEATRFLESFRSDQPLVLMNTDTASPYTRIPFSYQADLTNLLLQSEVSILIGGGHSEEGLGNRLLETIPVPLRSRVRLIPGAMSLEAFSAVGDQCDLFVTGDTGPMHIAAARKVSRTGKYPVRNRTAVLCIFGATPSRMSGYDSFQPGYLPSNQEAPSWTVVAGSPCRNITCINKLFKTCQTVRCFETIDMRNVLDLVAPHLKLVRRTSASESIDTPASTQLPP